MNNIDDYFQEVAFSMGYKVEDLLPIDRRVIQLQSASFTKGMSEKERQFYFNKKMAMLFQRQNNIFKEVEREIKKRQYSYKMPAYYAKQLQNPSVMKLLEDHEKMINKNKHYLDIIFRKKTIDQANQTQKRALTNQKPRHLAESYRTNRSTVSNQSDRSKQTIRSNASAASNRSKLSTASNQERLIAIRQKQKEEENLKKRLFQLKQKEDSKKFLRAMDNISRKSQRIKAKAAISKQIVAQNKRELDSIKNTQIKDHLERLKFKIQKTEMIRVKNQERKEESRARYSRDDKELRRHLLQQKQQVIKSRYDEKYKTASLRVEHQSLAKKQARNFNKMIEELKSHNAQQTRQQKNNEEQLYLANILKYEEYRLRTAEINRNSLRDRSKQKQIEREIKQDIARKNLQSMNHRRFRQTQELKRRIDHKFNQIREIDQIKRKLTKQSQRIKKDITFDRQSIEVDRYRPKFNSFFDIQ